MHIHRRSPLYVTAALGLVASLAGAPAIAASKPAAEAQHAPAATPAAPATQPSQVQATSAFDYSPLPVVTGTVAQYLLTSTGDVAGLLLSDGTQVLCPHRLGDAATQVVRPGEQVSVSGLKGRVHPIVRAYAISGPRGRRIADEPGSETALPPSNIGPDVAVDGTVLAQLYDITGAVQGVVMRDHSLVYVGRANAARLANWLRPGATLHAIGTGVNGGRGTAINAREIGPDVNQAIHIVPADAPPPGAFPGSAAYDRIPGSDTSAE
ncbi:hypothetical protein [Novacetimonas hansenii]|uniref:hypothetical protein n=1 Tax=Novacetimonas hansenii TaxID=436 RepID=UPI000789BBE3|nr:hypothetical protein [Novacetimonas hansenii]RFP05980.1 hypothetical protein BGC30_13180 [Novacetimonas hansenii]WEQ58152.1 hypothetical protein LV563_09720 [Novacetimonas hansenii]CUW48718.1 hypothetical protein ATCC53582_02864 [Novacetimonas hansenii]